MFELIQLDIGSVILGVALTLLGFALTLAVNYVDKRKIDPRRLGYYSHEHVIVRKAPNGFYNKAGMHGKSNGSFSEIHCSSFTLINMKKRAVQLEDFISPPYVEVSKGYKIIDISTDKFSSADRICLSNNSVDKYETTELAILPESAVKIYIIHNDPNGITFDYVTTEIPNPIQMLIDDRAKSIFSGRENFIISALTIISITLYFSSPQSQIFTSVSILIGLLAVLIAMMYILYLLSPAITTRNSKLVDFVYRDTQADNLVTSSSP